MNDDRARREDEPTTPLGFLAADMMKLLDDQDGVKGIVMLCKDDEGMTAYHGYEEGEDMQAFADLFGYLRSISEANGRTLLLIPMEGPSQS